MIAAPGPLTVCPVCGVQELTTEPAVDEEGAPTGALEVVCSGCGYEMGEIPAPEPSPEAEPTIEEPDLAPSPEEAHDVPGRVRHRVWP